MLSKKIISRLRRGGALTLLLSTSSTLAALEREGYFSYSHFGQPVALRLESGSIAIPVGENENSIQRNLDALSKNAANTKEADSDIRSGWRKLQANERSGLTAPELATALIADGATFASPVLKDTKDRDMFITQRIWIALPYRMDAKDKTRILNSVNGAVKVTLESSPVRLLEKPVDSPQGKTIRLEYTGNPDGNELYAVDVSLADGMEILAEVERLSRDRSVASAEPDMVMIGQSFQVAPPNDPLYAPISGAGQWYLWENYLANSQPFDFGLNSLLAWDRGLGYSSIKVAVLDSGIQTNHPDLPVAGGRNFTDVGAASAYGPTEQFANHGTLVAGVINATINNATGIAGLAPNVRLYSLKIGKNYTDQGAYQSTTTWIVNALNWCAENNIRITNTSNGFPISAGITTAYANTMSNGITHFAATGNGGNSTINYPASLSSVIAVGAITLDGTRASFSDYGTGLDIMAPGVLILTTDRTGANGVNDPGDYSYENGTSMASPLAAATAALILSKNPGLTPAEVKSALQSTARNLGSSNEYGSGLINPTAAVDSVTAGVFYAADFINSVDGWKQQSTFGWVLDEAFPNYFHAHHGWQRTTSTDPNSMWTWDYQSNSWWLIGIGPGGAYPWIWRSDHATWYYYLPDTCCPRWFQNGSTLQWVNF